MIKWAVQFPDGSVPAEYFYESKEDLKRLAPESITGGSFVVRWKDLKKQGYKARCVEVHLYGEH